METMGRQSTLCASFSCPGTQLQTASFTVNADLHVTHETRFNIKHSPLLLSGLTPLSSAFEKWNPPASTTPSCSSLMFLWARLRHNFVVCAGASGRRRVLAFCPVSGSIGSHDANKGRTSARPRQQRSSCALLTPVEMIAPLFFRLSDNSMRTALQIRPPGSNR